MDTTEEEVRIKFSGDSSGYEAAVDRNRNANEKLYQSTGKIRKGLIAFGSEISQAKSGLDLLGDSITTATRVFRVGLGAMVAAGVGNALASQIRGSAEEIDKLQEGFTKVAEFGERNKFKGIGQLTSEIKEAEKEIEELAKSIDPKASNVHEQFKRQLIFAQTGKSPEAQDRDTQNQIDLLGTMISKRKDEAADLAKREMDDITLRKQGRGEEADVAKRTYAQAQKINEADAGPGGQRAADALREAFAKQNEIDDRKLQLAKDEITAKLGTGFGKHEIGLELGREMSETQRAIAAAHGTKGKDDKDKDELNLELKLQNLNKSNLENNAAMDMDREKYNLAQKMLGIQSTNVSQEEKKRATLQAEIESLRAQADIEQSIDEEKAKSDRLAAQAKENENRQNIQELNYGKSALDIQRRMHAERTDQRRRDKFNEMMNPNGPNQGLLPFGQHKDGSGNILSGRDPVTGRTIQGRAQPSLTDRLTPHLERDRINRRGQWKNKMSDDAFHDLFKRKIGEASLSKDHQVTARKQQEANENPVVKAIRDQTNEWIKALMK